MAVKLKAQGKLRSIMEFPLHERLSA